MSDDDRALLLGVHQMGPKMIAYLEAVGVDSLANLAACEGGEWRMRINVHLGGPHINAMGERALDNAVAAARRALRGDNS